MTARDTTDTRIRLIAGLGNPGAEYALTRHNVGFWLVDRLVERYGGRFKSERKFAGEAAAVEIDGASVRLFKPMTYMNRSGLAVRSACAYWRISPAEILVAYDELDLPAGTARLKWGGGDAGHNGMRDTIAHMGRDFMRLRIGVGRPAPQADVVDYVLHRPDAEQKAQIDEAIAAALDAIPVLLAEGEQKAMHQLHTRKREPGSNNETAEGSD